MDKAALVGYTRLLRDLVLDEEELLGWRPMDEATASLVESWIDDGICGKVLRMSYGLDGLGKRNVKTIAEEMGIELYRARNLRRDCLGQLRGKDQMRQLIIFLNGSQADREKMIEFRTRVVEFWGWLEGQEILKETHYRVDTRGPGYWQSTGTDEEDREDTDDEESNAP